MTAEERTGIPVWRWVLSAGAVAQGVVALVLLFGDRSGIRPEVARDILIVGVVGLAAAATVALLAPSAPTSKVIRRVLIGVVVLVMFVSLAGAMALAVKAWVAVPAGIMIIGLLLLYRSPDVAEGPDEARSR